jgi:hypothetical protein
MPFTQKCVAGREVDILCGRTIMVSVGIHSVKYYIIFSFTSMDTVAGEMERAGEVKEGLHKIKITSRMV